MGMTDVEHTTLKTPRHRLPNRRPSHTEALEVGGQAFTATIGFDPESGQPCELFLDAHKRDSMFGSMLADSAVAISVALQHGISAAALAKSIGQLPAVPVGPADLESHQPGRVAASPIGAALDLLCSFDQEHAE